MEHESSIEKEINARLLGLVNLLKQQERRFEAYRIAK